MKQPKLTYTFHNPNPPEVMQEFLVTWYAEALVELRKERLQAMRDKDNAQDVETSAPT